MLKYNNKMLEAYWNAGRIIVENEQNGNIKAKYGKQVIKELKHILGRGFSVSNLFNIRKFYYISKIPDIVWKIVKY